MLIPSKGHILSTDVCLNRGHAYVASLKSPDVVCARLAQLVRSLNANQVKLHLFYRTDPQIAKPIEADQSLIEKK